MASKIDIVAASILILALLVSSDAADHSCKCEACIRAPDPHCYSIEACFKQCQDSGYTVGYCSVVEQMICICGVCTSQEPFQHPRKSLSLDP
ncbi:hypothetical protein ZWY2020_000965 [Hordeum vulgare]|nr:hypothetical protein ZWY2020_000965 [Hordeum vulgare]